MASLRGLALWALANQAMGDALIVNVGGRERCMVAEMAPNRLAGGQVPQIRFICDGFCGIPAAHPSKQCRQIDRSVQAGVNVGPPPGLSRDTGVKVPTPYRAGAGGAAAPGRGAVIPLFGR